MDGTHFVDGIRNNTIDLLTLKNINRLAFTDYIDCIRCLVCIDTILKNLYEYVVLDIVNPIKRDIEVDKIKYNIENNRSLFEYDAKNYKKYVFLKKQLDD